MAQKNRNHLEMYKNTVAFDKCSVLADRLMQKKCYKLLLKLFLGLLPSNFDDWDHPGVRWEFNDTPRGKRVLKVTARLLFEIRKVWESAVELAG